MPQIPIPAPPGKKLDWIINNPVEHRVVEQIECEDGHLLSVQASGGHYCTWRQSLSTVPARTVEVQTKDAPEGWDATNIEGPGGGGDTYGWISVENVRRFIASHGGEKGVTAPTQLDRIEALLERLVENTATQAVTIDNRSLAAAVRRGITHMKETA